MPNDEPRSDSSMPSLPPLNGGYGVPRTSSEDPTSSEDQSFAGSEGTSGNQRQAGGEGSDETRGGTEWQGESAAAGMRHPEPQPSSQDFSSAAFSSPDYGRPAFPREGYPRQPAAGVPQFGDPGSYSPPGMAGNPNDGASSGRPGSTRAQRSRRAPNWTSIIATAAVVGLISGGASAYAIDLAGSSIGGGSPTVVQAEQGEIDWTTVADAVSNSVVSIQVVGQQGSGQGSGVVWDQEGHILTNHHVVQMAEEGAEINILIGNSGYPATYVGGDAATDLAVVRMGNPPDGLSAISRGDSEAISVGDPVMAVGSPLGLSGSVTTGIVSALDRPVSTGEVGDSLVVTNAIQTSAPLNPGNSGGALVDSAGQLIGINSAIATLGGEGGSGSIGIGFAIPMQLATNIATQIIDTGEVQHAYLGTSTTNGQANLGQGTVLGAEVAEVVEDGPADEAGIEEGDVITGINDEWVTSSEHLVGSVRALKVGEEAKFTVVRGGEQRDFTVTMGVSPDLGG